MKLKFEVEIDTDNVKDQEKLEEIIELLNTLKQLAEEAQ
jgi:hypothetical protein